jgi:F-type H+-transporting ATPase subunit beta
MPENIGHVIQISGPAVDVQFTEAAIPLIYTALRVVSDGFKVPQPIDVILEVQQHLGEGRVRCVAMQATEGMVRGMNAIDLGGPISVPVGRQTLGRVMNVIGEPVDNLGPSARRRACRFIAWLRPSMNNPPAPRCSRPASRSST